MLSPASPVCCVLCVLVVEDSQSTSKMISYLLTRHYSYRCTIAGSYEEALQHLSSPWDLLVVDVCLPGSSATPTGLRVPAATGLELVRAVRAHEEQQGWRPQCIVAMSADDSYRQAAEEAGCSEFVYKYDKPVEQILRICVAVSQAKVSVHCGRDIHGHSSDELVVLLAAHTMLLKRIIQVPVS